MSRPTNPSKFADVEPIFEAAYLNQGLRFMTPEPAKATTLAHRLNRYRKALRDTNGQTVYDNFVVRAVGAVVEISPRVAIDWSQATKLDGSPINEIVEDPYDLNEIMKAARASLRLDEE